MEKKCFKCGKTKKLNEFSKHKGMADGHLGKCKECARKYALDYREKNIEKVREKDRQRAKLPHRRKYQLRNQLRKFGITLADYDKMFNDQNGVCAICGKTNLKRRRLAIDHNHKTNKVRGLLCGKCNKAIGLFEENPEILEKAIKYLK